MNIRKMFSDPKSLMYILVAGIATFVFVMVIYIFKGRTEDQEQKANLVVWGVYNEPRIILPILKSFEKQNKGISIMYVQKSPENYEKDTLEAMAANKGPDIWIVHNTWVSRHFDKIKPAPSKVSWKEGPLITIKDFRAKFVDVAYDDLVIDDSIYSLPMYVDTLGLYYNKDMLNSAGFTRPPKTWEEFNTYVKALTKLDDFGNVKISGAAMGSSKNINRSTDILMLLMMQAGAVMNDEKSYSPSFANQVQGQYPGQMALQYYTDFTKPSKQVYCWNDSMHYSIDAFVQEKVAMMLNYSHQIGTIRTRAPRLNFTVAQAPQNENSDKVINFASYWTPVVTRQSRNPDIAWKLIDYLSSAEAASIYLDGTSRPSARRDIIEKQRIDPELGVFAVQAISAKSWKQYDSDAVENIFAEMIDSVNFGRMNIEDAVQAAQTQVSTLRRK